MMIDTLPHTSPYALALFRIYADQAANIANASAVNSCPCPHKSNGKRSSTSVQSNPATVSIERQIVNAIRKRNSVKLIELFCTAGAKGIERFNKNQRLKIEVEDLIRHHNEKNNAIQAVSLAAICFDVGFNYERYTHNPITTRTLIVSGQKACPSLTASMMASAIRCDLKFPEEMIRLTTIDSDENVRSIDDVRASADLVLATLEKGSLSPDVRNQYYYDIALARLGDPTTGRGTYDRDLSDINERVNLGVSVAYGLLANKFPFTSDTTIERMSIFIRGLRTVAEMLYEEGLIDEAHLVMKEVLKLTLKSLGTYEIRGITINTTFASINSMELPLDNYDCSLIERIVQEAFKVKKLREYLHKETLDILTQKILNCDPERAPITTLIIATEALNYGMIFDMRTLNRVYDLVRDEIFPSYEDLNDRKEMLRKIVIPEARKTNKFRQSIASHNGRNGFKYKGFLMGTGLLERYESELQGLEPIEDSPLRGGLDIRSALSRLQVSAL